jgi:hypothetical protein
MRCYPERLAEQNLGAATQRGVTTVDLLFEPSGGKVGDGVSLFNYFDSFPLELHIYNTGMVASVAVTSFLGAPPPAFDHSSCPLCSSRLPRERRVAGAGAVFRGLSPHSRYVYRCQLARVARSGRVAKYESGGGLFPEGDLIGAFYVDHR